jgi:uncharacterized protein (DUF3084 family)
LSTAETTKLRTPEAALARAEAQFKKKELQALEGQQAMAEYRAKAAATRENTARLRELRLASEEAARRQAAAAKRKPDAPAKRKTA